jgi:hypothetical protein
MMNTWTIQIHRTFGQIMVYRTARVPRIQCRAAINHGLLPADQRKKSAMVRITSKISCHIEPLKASDLCGMLFHGLIAHEGNAGHV